MKWILPLLLMILVGICGCKKPFWQKSAKNTSFQENRLAERQKPRTKDVYGTRATGTLQTVLAGRIKEVNEKARFVIISFPIGRMPQPGQLMWVYRDGQRVGRIKITGPQMDLNIAADILEGDAQLEDEVRLE